MSLKDLISPFYVWKRAFEKPYTDKKPLEDRPGAERYRGFHQNDMEKCIGCGTCEMICQNAAIDMVPVEGIGTTFQDSGLRPRIDYGRCCWCALCVDICTTASLTMSNEYVWVDEDADVFRFVPGVDPQSWDQVTKGYRRSEAYGLLHLDRQSMPTIPVEKGLKSFLEVVKGYSREEAVREADRCVDCGLCVASCPAHMDIPDYIRAIGEDDLEKAVKLLYRTNPLPATCGRICTRKCEDACSIGILGDPIAIRWLKRYIIDRCQELDLQHILGEDFKSRKEKVAIVGAGPGGLSAAYFLATTGYRVMIFEATDKAGGMIRWGVPEYRMPSDKLDREIQTILDLGVEIAYNKKIGRDIDFGEIYKEFDAVFCSTGLVIPYKMEIPGEEAKEVIPGLKLLDDVARGKTPHLGSKVAVIGGGNVAMDAARTARRMGAEVTVIYRRREEDMPADREEIQEAKHENIEFVTRAIPVEIKKTSRNRLSFTWNNAEMRDQGEGKRPRPVPRKGDLSSLEFDSIIPAIGQGPDFSFLPEDFRDRIRFKKYKLITDSYGQTTDPKVFAGGDIVNSEADAISAVADGYRAAKGIDRMLLKKGNKQT